MKKTTGYIQGSLIAIFILLFLYSEYFYYYAEFACGCSSDCQVYSISKTAKIVSYFGIALCIVGVVIISRSAIPKYFLGFILILLSLILYGNSFMLYNNGGCGPNICKRVLYYFDRPLGDFATDQMDNLNIDSIKTNKYVGKLLGFKTENNCLILYRIGASPIIVKTSFLVWHIDTKKMVDDFINGYSLAPQQVGSIDANIFTFLGGKDMPKEAFIQDLPNVNKIWKLNFDLANGQTQNIENGTTIFIVKGIK